MRVWAIISSILYCILMYNLPWNILVTNGDIFQRKYQLFIINISKNDFALNKINDILNKNISITIVVCQIWLNMWFWSLLDWGATSRFLSIIINCQTSIINICFLNTHGNGPMLQDHSIKKTIFRGGGGGGVILVLIRTRSFSQTLSEIQTF